MSNNSTLITTITNMRVEMRKILHRRINHSKILPKRWSEGVVKYTDLLGNCFEVPRLCVYLEDNKYEELVAYDDELVLYDENGRIGGWNVENGHIYWG